MRCKANFTNTVYRSSEVFEMPGIIRILFESYALRRYAHDTKKATSSKFPRTGARLEESLEAKKKKALFCTKY